MELRAEGTPPALPGVEPRMAMAATVAAALWIVRGELDHILGQVLDGSRTWSPNTLSGPLGWGSKADGWRFFHDRAPKVDGRTPHWLVEYGAADLALTCVLIGMLVVALRRVRPPGRHRTVMTGLAGLSLAAALLIDVLLIAGAPAAAVIVTATAVFWVSSLVPVVDLVVAARTTWWHWLRLAPMALYTHRYSAVVVLPLGLLSLGRGPDLLEQVPDIQRRWADPGQHGGFFAAALVMLLLVVAVFTIGRQRTHYLWLRTLPPPPHPPKPALLVWFLGPALMLVAAAVVDAAGGPVDWWRLGVFCGIPVVLASASLALRRFRPGLKRPVRGGVDLERFRAAAYAGDLLWGLLPVVAGLGVLRAFTAVLALDGASGWALLIVATGVVTLLGCWWTQDLIVRWLAGLVMPQRYAHPTRLDRIVALVTPGVSVVARDAGPARRQWLSWTVLAVAFASTGLVAVVPVPLADTLGVIATFQLALGSVSVLVAALVILFQPGGSPEVFWPLRLAFVPTTALIVIAMVFAAEVGGGADVHGIRPYSGPQADAAPQDRPSLDSVFGTWLTAGDSCAQDLPGATGLRVRPLLMYAAEGGGVRAAYWTADAVDRIDTPAPSGAAIAPICRGAFLSSGASGGSVGLSIASVRRPGTAAAAVRAIAGQQALGAAADGLVVRDTIFGAAGLPLPSLGDPGTHGADWSDRATLIEQAWEKEIPQLRDPFLRTHSATDWDWGPAGALAINSTSTTTACRTLISQVLLPGSTSTECAPGQPAPNSTDLVSCTGQLRTSTAALLTARFPYVTPSGVVDCDGEEMQIVDGGYAENFGVGTLDDLTPRLIGEVRRHNSCVLERMGDPTACPGEPSATTLVVPQLVYFDNGTGADLTSTPSGLDLEVLVPPVTLLEAKGALYSARAQLERAQAALATDQLWERTAPDADAVATAVDAWRRNPVAVVYQATRPAIAAPLGWVLSDASMRTMDQALCDQEDVEQLGYGSETTSTDQTAKHRQFGTIDDVLDLLPGTSEGC